MEENLNDKTEKINNDLKTKKNRKFLITIFFIVILIVIGFGFIITNNNKYYTDISIPNLKTFTEIVGISEKNKEEKGTNVIYYYQFKANENYVSEYEDYLLNTYGFSINQVTSNKVKRYFEYDNNTLITVESQNEYTDIVDYTITIPLVEEKANKNAEICYNNAKKLMENKDYESAKEIFSTIKEYKDSEEYIYYCNAMEYYDLKCYGFAIERFSKCENILNAKELKEELLEIVGKYNGSYYYEHPNTSAIGYYMFVNNGKVDILSKSIYNKGNSVGYNYSFMGKYNENTNSYDLYVGTNFAFELELKNYEFLFYELPDGGIALSSQNGSVNTMYSGVYDKISNNVPQEK